MENKTTSKDEAKKISDIVEEVLEHKGSSSNKGKIRWGSQLVAAVLIFLVAISIIQAVQSVTILSKIKSGAIKPASAGTSGTGGSALPSSLENLPDMVGGC